MKRVLYLLTSRHKAQPDVATVGWARQFDSIWERFVPPDDFDIPKGESLTADQLSSAAGISMKEAERILEKARKRKTLLILGKAEGKFAYLEGGGNAGISKNGEVFVAVFPNAKGRINPLIIEHELGHIDFRKSIKRGWFSTLKHPDENPYVVLFNEGVAIKREVLAGINTANPSDGKKWIEENWGNLREQSRYPLVKACQQTLKAKQEMSRKQPYDPRGKDKTTLRAIDEHLVDHYVDFTIDMYDTIAAHIPSTDKSSVARDLAKFKELRTLANGSNRSAFNAAAKEWVQNEFAAEYPFWTFKDQQIVPVMVETLRYRFLGM